MNGSENDQSVIAIQASKNRTVNPYFSGGIMFS